MRFMLHIVFQDNIVDANDYKQQEYVNVTVLKALRTAALTTMYLENRDFTWRQWALSEFKTEFPKIVLKTTPSVGLQDAKTGKTVFLLGYKTYDQLVKFFHDVMNGNPIDTTNTTDRGGSDKDGKDGSGNQNGNGGNGNGNGGFGIPKKWWLYIGAATGAAAILSDGALKQTVLGGAAGYSFYQYFKK